MIVKSTEILGETMALPRLFNEARLQKMSSRNSIYEALKQIYPDKKFFVKKIKYGLYEIYHKHEHLFTLKQTHANEVSVCLD